MGSPHDGFIFFGGIFGLPPLALLLAAFVAGFRVRNETDIFFALFTAQVTLSFLFEVLPGSYSYAFALCLIGAKAFIRTPIGRELAAQTARPARRKFLSFGQ